LTNLPTPLAPRPGEPDFERLAVLQLHARLLGLGFGILRREFAEARACTEQSVCANSLGSVLIQQNAAAEGTPGTSGDEAPTTAPATPAEPTAEHGS
jgi:hypothetical protein